LVRVSDSIYIGVLNNNRIKGRQFTVPNLLNDEEIVNAIGAEPAIAIFRLAPQDYHRYHSPVAGVFSKLVSLPGEYYTVNPQAVNEPGFDVFTANKRDVALIDARLDNSGVTVPVAFVAIGALLVASITWTKQVGEPLIKGWFTVIESRSRLMSL
jgi:phosphatidylserine decarboxylase